MSTLFQRLLEDPTLVRLSVLEAVTWRNHCLRQFGSIHLEVASSRHKGLYLEDAVREACPSGDTCGVNNCIALRERYTIGRSRTPTKRGQPEELFYSHPWEFFAAVTEGDRGTRVSEKIIPQVRSKPLKSMWSMTSFGTENMRFCVSTCMCSHKHGERTQQSCLGEGGGGRRARAWFSLLFSLESKLSRLYSHVTLVYN